MPNPFVHVELGTSDAVAAKKFYGAVFKWKFNDVPDMNWSGIDVGGGVGGGLAATTDPQQPVAWTPYVAVDSVEATIAKAKANGATIVVPYMEVPGMGSLGIFVDPQGATIGVWQAAAQPPAKAPAKAKAKAKAKPAAKAKKPAAKKKPGKRK